MIILVVSILVLTTAVWLFNKATSVNVCPICAGVSLTWIFSLIGQFAGLLSTADWELPTAILIGGSVVGIAYRLEDKLYVGASKLIWKTIFIPLGFFLAYGLVQFNLPGVVMASLLLCVVVVCFRARGSGVSQKKARDSGAAGELMEKMKDCC